MKQLIGVLLMSSFLAWPAAAAPPADQCVACHTDADRLRETYTPPEESGAGG